MNIIEAIVNMHPTIHIVAMIIPAFAPADNPLLIGIPQNSHISWPICGLWILSSKDTVGKNPTKFDVALKTTYNPFKKSSPKRLCSYYLTNVA